MNFARECGSWGRKISPPKKFCSVPLLARPVPLLVCRSETGHRGRSQTLGPTRHTPSQNYKLLYGFLISSLFFLLFGCAPTQTDRAGGLRVVSTAPNITEILFAIGLDDEIVGITTHCNYPPETKDKRKIGTFSRPNIESIIKLSPDIVFITGLEQESLMNRLSDLGIETVKIFPRNIDELYLSILNVGSLTGRVDRAGMLVAEMKRRIDRIKVKVSAMPAASRKSFLIEITDDPLIVAGKDSFVGQLGDIAGGENIAFDTDRAYSKFSPELVINRDPDCIILGYMYKESGAAELVEKRIGYSGITAVREKAVFNDIDPDILLRPGPRAAEAAEEIYKRLYGDT